VSVFTVAALLLLLPYAGMSPAGALPQDSEDTLTSPGSRTMRVGWPGLVDDLQTLNPLLAMTNSEVFVTKVSYSTLLTKDDSNEFVGDLATKFEVLPDLMTWHIQIVETANFYDKNVPGEQLPLTTADVMFTYWLVQNNSEINQPYAFPELPSAGGSLIESMWANGDFEMWIKLRVPYAPFLSALSVIPILPKYIWEARSWDWPNFDSTYPPCVGSGPWYYGLDGTPGGATVVFYENPEWFATEEYGLQLHVDTLVLMSESEDSNMANYKIGALDVMTDPTPAQFVDPTLPGDKWQSSQGFVFEFNMNQMTDDMRNSVGFPYTTGSSNQLLLDPVVKLALQMSVDKEEFVAQALQGLGKPADSLIPDASPWYYDYGGGGPTAPPGEEEIAYDPAAARWMLYANGWRYRLTGTEILPGDPDYDTYYPLSKIASGIPTETLQFRYVYPKTDTFFTIGARVIEQTSEIAGIDLLCEPVSAAVMNNIWQTADYDTWLWNWCFTPNSEPSVDVMELLTTDAIGVWSDVFWSNATFDALYYESLSEADASIRALILDEMQRMAYLHSGCWPVAWMDTLYAAQSASPEYWQNYGNWTQDYPLTVDSGYPWLFIQVYPADNPAPQILDWVEYYESLPTIPVNLDATIVDEGPSSSLAYMWNFGDGTKSPWLSSPGTTHLYAEEGWYDAWLIVKELDTLDGFITSRKAVVCVMDPTQTAPHSLDFTYEPSDPDNGTLVHFNGTAVDDDGDALAYSWAFGDGFTAVGQKVTHQFAVGSRTYNVTMYVDDGHVSHPGGVRPVSICREVPIGENSPPWMTVPDYIGVERRQSYNFSVDAGDSDERDRLTFTWDWGDGSPLNVTLVPWETHLYRSSGLYTIRVHCDDQTGLAGHNVTDTGLVPVSGYPNKAPEIVFFSASNTTPCTEQVVEFTAMATDEDGDILEYTFHYGDGDVAMVQVEQGVYVSANHSYEFPGSYSAYLTVSDFQAAPVTSDTIALEVSQGNQAPDVDALPQVVATTGFEELFSASATDVDGDPLTYTWDFRDGSDLVVGNPVTHTYEISTGEFGMLYTVHVDDGQDHNVTANGIVLINWLPWIEEPLEPMFVVGGESDPYTLVVSDNDSDEIVTTWDFGDGSPMMVGATVLYAYAVVAVETEFTLTVYVDDGYDDPAVSHNISASTTVTVLPEPDIEPPVADAGPDQPVLAGELVTFDGSESCDNVGIVSWVWTFMWDGYPVELEGEIATFIFDDTNVDVTVTLTVTDAGDNTDTDDMVVHVGEWIPELPMVALPVIGILIVFGCLLTLRRRRVL
jgi:ABC-type transport system substrate-binding protein